VTAPSSTRLEVWGDPIDHSRSPRLHTSAYRVLGLDWTYGRRKVDTASFDRELSGIGPEFRGLSLTMPLKGAAHAAATTRDRRAELTGAVNTLLLARTGRAGFNTDVGGIVRALADDGVTTTESARIVGTGATATSALVALSELGAAQVDVVARRPAAVTPLHDLGASLGIRVSASPFDAHAHAPVPVTIATIAGDADVAERAADSLADSGGLLLDVVYGHWPTALARAWSRAGGDCRDGLGMLLHQALLQVRVFVSGDPDAELPDEGTVLAAMRRAVMED
jgi:shikimate dehydrogenase